jgi:hypothetical protein
MRWVNPSIATMSPSAIVAAMASASGMISAIEPSLG